MLCLKVAAPEYLVVKFVIVLFQKLDRLCIGYMSELRIDHMVQAVQKSFIYKGIKEIHLLRSVLQHIADHIFQHILSKIHVIIQVCKRTLRLDHPEFSRMTGGVGVFCSESRSKSINVAECLSIGFTVQLSAYCKVCLFSKEILSVINLSVVIYRRILRIQSGNTEHFSCSLTVASCDQRCMDIYKASLLEKFMDCICTERTDTEHCLEGICPWS